MEERIAVFPESKPLSLSIPPALRVPYHPHYAHTACAVFCFETKLTVSADCLTLFISEASRKLTARAFYSRMHETAFESGTIELSVRVFIYLIANHLGDPIECYALHILKAITILKA